jgi:hypothetical protein
MNVYPAIFSPVQHRRWEGFPNFDVHPVIVSNLCHADVKSFENVRIRISQKGPYDHLAKYRWQLYECATTPPMNKLYVSFERGCSDALRDVFDFTIRLYFFE